MDSRLKFLPRPTHVITLPGTVERSGSGHVDRPYVRVEKSRRNVKDAGQPIPSAVESTCKKSWLGELVGCPYRKPTQVGEASSLRSVSYTHLTLPTIYSV